MYLYSCIYNSKRKDSFHFKFLLFYSKSIKKFENKIFPTCSKCLKPLMWSFKCRDCLKHRENKIFN